MYMYMYIYTPNIMLTVSAVVIMIANAMAHDFYLIKVLRTQLTVSNTQFVERFKFIVNHMRILDSSFID